VGIEPEASSSKNARGGASVRNRFSYKRKLEIIEKVLENQKKRKSNRTKAMDMVSSATGIAVQTISKWMKNQNDIRDCAATQQIAKAKCRFNRKWIRDLRYLEEVLGREVRNRRKLGLTCLPNC
jgi:hypothetical protein